MRTGEGRHLSRPQGRTKLCLLPGESYLESYSVRCSFAVNRTQWIIGKATVFIVVSCFKHIFIIIYLHIPLHTILYITFTYFYNYIFFHVLNILSIFTAIETLLLVFTIYSFLKMLVATKI